jgi:hypothetical protein
MFKCPGSLRKQFCFRGRSEVFGKFIYTQA